MREKQSGLSRWTEGNWRQLVGEFGEEVARAFRDGTVSYWRNYRPQLRSEGAPENSVPYSVIFGLTGLSIEAKETPDWPSTLTQQDVELACRYGNYELNGFPSWLPALFERHPEMVGSFQRKEIEYELSIEDAEADTHHILSNLSWSGEWAWEALSGDVLALLSSREPANLSNLSRLLTIVQGSSVVDERIEALARKKVGSLRRLNHLAQWYAVWTGVNPDAAIPALADRLAAVESREEQTTFAMQYLTHLLGGRRTPSTRVREVYQTPKYLKDLYLLMHRYIRAEEDLERAGTGVYSPGLRDDAQEGRNGLFEQLRQIPGKGAFLALQEIAGAHPSRPWLVLQAKSKATQDADLQPWSAAQVRDFSEKHERTPATHRELAELALMRLLDLKDDLEHGDSSIAKILRGVSDETDMRKYIGRELRKEAHGRYSIPQEEEFADAKKPDLRFHGMGFDAPVPAELKLADNWTGPKLLERLGNQLCGDYLRDQRSGRGLFVIVYRGEKKGWDIPGIANRVDFEGLVAALRSRWMEISSRFPGIEDIAVVGIDLTKRSRSADR